MQIIMYSFIVSRKKNCIILVSESLHCMSFRGRGKKKLPSIFVFENAGVYFPNFP